MNQKYCDSCGQQVMSSMRICPACGNRSFSISPPQEKLSAPIIIQPPLPTLSPASSSHQPAKIWNRVWARGIDLAFASAIALVVTNILPSVNLFESHLATVLVDFAFSAIIFCILITIYDAMFLSSWGSSPGKAMMGLYIRDSNGLKLTASLAQRRAWSMLGSGLSYMLFYPLLQFINLFFIVKNNTTKWDNGEFGVVLQRPVSNLRRVAVIFLSLILVTLDIGVHTVLKEINKKELRNMIIKT